MFNGNPLWLEYLDTNVLQNYPGKNFDEKIKTLSNELAIDDDFKTSFDNVKAIEIEEILRGVPCLRDPNEVRDILFYCFVQANSEQDPKDLVPRFPEITGINDASEVQACIDFADSSISDQPETKAAWTGFLENTFNEQGELDRLVSEFLFNQLSENRNDLLYNPYYLADLAKVLTGASEANPDDLELKKTFEESILGNPDRAAKFSAIAAHEIRPSDYPLPDSVSIISARADYNYLEREGLLKNSETWLRDLDSAIGLGPEPRKALLIEFLIRKHRDTFSSKEKLAHSINLLQAGIPPKTEEDETLIRSYKNHINRFGNRLTPLVLNTHFPNLFQLDPTKLDNDNNLNIIRTLLQPIRQTNPSWTRILLDCKPTDIEDNENFLARTYNEYLSTRLDPETSALVFASQDSLSNTLEVLHNTKKTTAIDQALLIGFYKFMKTKYPKNFNLIQAQKELGKLVSINTEARNSHFKAAQITNFAIAGSVVKSPWDQIFKSSLPETKNPVSTQSILAVRISKFLRETGKEKEFKKIEEVSSTLLGHNSLDKRTLPQRKSLFREFTFWLEKDLNTNFDRKLLSESFPGYFDYPDTVATADDLHARIEEVFTRGDHTINEDWLKLVEATVTKYNSTSKEEPISLTRYLARFIRKQADLVINSEDDLLANLGVMLACEPIEKRQGLIKPPAFAQRIREDNPDLRVAEINSFFPGALEGIIKDIDFNNPQSIEENIRDIFQRDLFPHRNISWYEKLQRYLNTEDLIPIFAKFLSQRTSNPSFRSDQDFVNTLLTLLGNTRIINKKNPQTKTLLMDFLDYIHDDEALSNIKLFAHTLFHETVPMTTEEVRLAINNSTPIYLKEGETVKAASNRAISDQKKGIEKDPNEPSNSEINDYVIQRVEKDYGISRVNLFALAGVHLLQDSNIWVNAISNSIRETVYVNPNRRKRTVTIQQKQKGLPGILNILNDELQPNTGTQKKPKTFTIDSLYEVGLAERKIYEDGITEDMVKSGYLIDATNLLNNRLFLRAIFPEVTEYQETVLAETPITNNRVIDPDSKETIRLVRYKIRFSTKGLYAFVRDSGDPNPQWHMLFYPLKINGTAFKIASKPNSKVALGEDILDKLRLPS